MKKIFCIGLLMIGSLSLQAQLSRTMHQVFEIDSVGMVKIDLWPQNDNYQWEVEIWPSRHLMVETNVGLTNANEAILDFLTEEKRYELKMEKGQDLITLSNVLDELTPIGTKKGDINETIRLIIYMPGFLEKVDETTWKRIQMDKKKGKK
jgi:hypothetical protein